MKKFSTLKSLLLLVCTMLGTAAWAQTEFEVEWIAQNRGTYENGTFTAANNAGNQFALALADLSTLDGISNAGTVTITFQVGGINAGTRWLVGIGDKSIRGTMAGASTRGAYDTSSGLLMYFGTRDGNYFRVNDGTNNSDAMNQILLVTVVLDRDNSKFSYTIKNAFDDTVYFEGSDLDASVQNATIIEAFTWQGNATIDLDPVSVAITASTVQHADYTVRYLNEDGAEIKEAVTRDGVVGSTPQLLASDKDAIYTEIDGTNFKFIYDYDDAADQEISSDGSTEVSVWFRAANTYTASLTLLDDMENPFVENYGETTGFEGDQVKIFYPHYYFDGYSYYVTPANSAYPWYAKIFTDAGTEEVVYTLSDIAYYTEVENMAYSHRWAADGAVPDRYSCGRAVRLYMNSYCYTEPIAEQGTYTLTLWARNQSSTQMASLPVFLRNPNSGDLIDLNMVIGEWNPADFKEITIEGVQIPAGFQLVLNNNTEYNSNLELDYLTLLKTSSQAEFPIPTAITNVETENSNSTWFNLQGQRVSQPVKGVYVKDGKKVLK